ncbi:hypothetical protein JHD49_11165 [Sulfurimonas sp. SAG-AH-194-C21]|nr:hypothetical protein [Sulfurimonas sp. SAG-AH-194-C21]MDF1884500.1 hypothetical protein [Sulfurimonas sp. SAG-AH-194-C21]
MNSFSPTEANHLYKFALTTHATVKLNNVANTFDVYFYDENMKYIYNGWRSPHILDLDEGVYYVLVNRYIYASSSEPVYFSVSAIPSVSDTDILELYVGILNRAADAITFELLQDNSIATQTELADEFFLSYEGQLSYPLSLSSSAFINKIYQNLFNRNASDNVLTELTVLLDSEQTSKSQIVVDILNDINNSLTIEDLIILNNKIEIASYYAEKGLDNISDAILVLENITNSIDTVNERKLYIDYLSGTANPVANAGVDQTVSLGNTVILDGTSSSQWAGLTYDWRKGNYGNNVTIDNNTEITASFIADTLGEYFIQFTVSGNINQRAFDTIRITVVP